MRQWVRKFVCAGLLLVVSTGCSARQAGFSGRFIKPGQPTADYADHTAAAVTAPNVEETVRKIRELQARATPKQKVSLLPTLETRDPELAAALLRLALLPTGESHRLAAAAYLNAGVADFAFRHYQRALQLAPCDSASYEGLARIWRGWGRPDLGLADAHRAIYCRPQSASAYNTLGTLLEALGQRKNAREALEFAVRLEPTAAFAFNNLCSLAVREGDGKAARQACERALALDPGMLAARTNLAMAFAIEGDIERAEALLLDRPDKARAHFNVGMLRMSVGDYKAAARAFDTAAASKPLAPEAWRRARQARQLASTGVDLQRKQ